MSERALTRCAELSDASHGWAQWCVSKQLLRQKSAASRGDALDAAREGGGFLCQV